jgi:hypothetical protein
MTVDDLRRALEGLPSERIQCLVDRLEHEPETRVTVGAWRPQCPMVLAGFNPMRCSINAPETRFAAVWDGFARGERRRWRWPIRLRLSHGSVARREDVKVLLRTANAVLAARTLRLDGVPQGEHAQTAGALFPHLDRS